jgi:hypothetical protein
MFVFRLADQCRCEKCFHSETFQRLSPASVRTDHSAVKNVVKVSENSVLVNYVDDQAHATLHSLDHFDGILHAETKSYDNPEMEDRLACVSMEEFMKEEKSGILKVYNRIEKCKWKFFFIFFIFSVSL